MNKRAIFDMDGTIIDSMPKWGTVLEDYFQSLGIVFDDNYKKTLIGLSMDDILKNVNRDFGLKEDPSQSFNNILEIMRDGYLNEFDLKPGVLNCLDILKSKGIRMAVATATPEHIALDALKANNLLEYFEFVQTCDNIGHLKSDPIFWKKASQKLESDISNSVVFEDALYCIQTVNSLNGNIVAIYDVTSSHDKNCIKSLSNQFLCHYDELDYDIFLK
ncbi:MAG: HAD family phosphatase [Lagierella massiliensis]|nr:HAD family phosphatase [Lagierella massiliensis]